METYLGLDFGGTKLLIGETDAQGHILASKRYPTGPMSQEDAAGLIQASLRDYLSRAGVRGTLAGAGVGVVGVSDHERGLWISKTHEITGPPIPLADIVSRALGVPAAIDNDVRSAAAAELLWGHGRACRDFIYINVGTGLAAGFVIDGKILRGANNNAGEVGHLCCDMADGAPCVCGRRGCAETALSGTGFAIQYRRLQGSFPASSLALDESGAMDAARLYALADQGDPLAKAITEKAAKILACLIMNLARVSDPELIVLGGGASSGGWLLDRARPFLVPSAMRGVKKGTVLSALDPAAAGLLGAAAVGMGAAKGT